MKNAAKLFSEYRLEFVVAVGGLIAMNLIFIAGAFRKSSTIDAEGAGLLGDFVGGYIGTFFAIMSVVLLIRTLQNQHSSSERASFEASFSK